MYKHICEIGEWDNWDMVQVADFNAEDKRELLATERQCVETAWQAAPLNRCQQRPENHMKTICT